jgi:heme exporter protein B
VLSQYRVLLRQGLRVDLANRERIVSPALFATTILLLFSFAIGQLPPQFRPRFFVAEAILTLFFALEIVFSRIFEPDQNDRVYELLRTYPVSPIAWFLAKYTQVLFLGMLLTIPAVVLAAMFSGVAPDMIWDPSLLLIFISGEAGIAAIGVLLSAATQASNARQILYPLLYFPLSTPVLLAMTNSLLIYVENGQMDSVAWGWLGLLAGIDLIFITLATLLFGELVETR